MIRGLAAVAALVAVAVACAPAPPPRPSPPDPFALDAAALAARDRKTANKVAARPLAYFRYVNRKFAERVCSLWASDIAAMPLVHVHGDAHIEQYAVAAGGRGLADFDASGEGPPVIDLARFATSLVLAWPADDAGARDAIGALLRGYALALEDPTATIAEPAPAMRLRSRFAPTTTAWLDAVTALMIPPAPEDREAFTLGWHTFVGEMCHLDPSLTEAFFTVKAGGRLDMGIGSAHAQKFIARIEGPTPAPDDDIVLEAKALEPGSIASCMRGIDLDATRVIEGQAQIAFAPQRFLSAMTMRGKPFYTHAWLVHYTELSVGDVASAKELAEVAEDVGLQLGRGHAKSKDPDKAPAIRRSLRVALDRVAPDLPRHAFDLAADITRAWQGYRAKLP